MANRTAVKAASDTSKKTTRKQPLVDPVLAERTPRRLHLPEHKLFRLKRIKHPTNLPSAWQLAKRTAAILWRQRRLFLGIALVYGVLNILFVRGFSAGTDVSSLKQQLGLGLSGNAGQLITGLSVFTTLIASSGNGASATAGPYQLFLGLIISLASIWALRQTTSGRNVRLRDAFYQGMYPLIPFLLVILVVLVQTLPFIIGGGLYSLVVTTGIALYTSEKLLWGLLFFVLAFISAYMLCSSIFALYIVTLPDMTPMKALRSARDLVRYRRGQVARNLFLLMIILLLVSGGIMLPIILWAAFLAQWVFFAMSMVGLIAVHAYIYTLYKALLE